MFPLPFRIEILQVLQLTKDGKPHTHQPTVRYGFLFLTLVTLNHQHKSEANLFWNLNQFQNLLIDRTQLLPRHQDLLLIFRQQGLHKNHLPLHPQEL